MEWRGVGGRRLIFWVGEGVKVTRIDVDALGFGDLASIFSGRELREMLLYGWVMGG
jgi:hypothetical protein